MRPKHIDYLAEVVSIILHPLLFPTLAFITLLYLSPVSILPLGNESKAYLLLVIFVFTALAPFTGILLFYTTGGLSSLRTKERRDRQLALYLVTVFYLFATILFVVLEGFRQLPLLAIITGSATLMLVVVITLEHFSKISVHSLGASAFIGLLLSLSYKYTYIHLLIPILISIVGTGVLMTARLHLNAHTPEEVLLGSGLGFVLVSLAIFLIL